VWSDEAFGACRDSETGETNTSVGLKNNRAAEGILDSTGLFHSVTGLRYQVYDLSEDGRLVSDTVLEQSSTAGGRLACVAADGRIAFPDDEGRLFVFHPGERAPVLAWTDSRVVSAPVIAGGRLYALDTEALLCFG
jgi:hypothetical protein